MAIRKRKGKTESYQVYWDNPATGKRESKTFKSREEAKKEDSLIKHRLLFERESFFIEKEREARSITLEEAYMTYLREKNFTKESLQRQLYALRPILCKWGKTAVSEVDYADVVLIASTPRKGRQLKASTIFRTMSIIRSALRHCAENGLCEMPRLPRIQHGIHEQLVPPTQEELEKMLAVAPPHLRRVIILGVSLGCRIGPCELFKMAWDNIDFTQAIARIPGTKKNLSQPWREVPIRESLLPILLQWHEEDRQSGVRHLIHYGGKPVVSIRHAWLTALRMAGITRRIRPYDLRHAFATELIAAGADIGTVAKLMGHNSPTMLLTHYQFVMDKQKRQAIESLPDLPNVSNQCAKEKAFVQQTENIQ